MVASGETGVRVEDLHDAERRVYDLASSPMPLAEVAVRLGLPIGEADRRILLLLMRLGLPSRAALQGAPEWDPQSEDDDAPANAGYEDETPARAVRARKRGLLFRRATLALPLLIALAIAAGAAYELSTSSAEGAAHPGAAADAPAQLHMGA